MDAIMEWSAGRQRVADLVRELPPDRTEAAVPACPDWTVRDLLSHMIGLGADVLRGDEPDDHNPAWTQAQVDSRAGHDVAVLLTEWDGVAAALPDWMREHGSRPLNDLVIHEQDLRGALGRPGARDTLGLAIVRARYAEKFAGLLAGRPPLALVGGNWSWTSAGDPGDPGDAAVVVRAGDFELARAMMSRRSEAQLRGWTVRGDVGPYLDVFAHLGGLPDRDLTESY